MLSNGLNEKNTKDSQPAEQRENSVAGKLLGGGGRGGAAVPLGPGRQGLLRLGRQLPGEFSDELTVEVGVAVLAK